MEDFQVKNDVALQHMIQAISTLNSTQHMSKQYAKAAELTLSAVKEMLGNENAGDASRDQFKGATALCLEAMKLIMEQMEQEVRDDHAHMIKTLEHYYPELELKQYGVKGKGESLDTRLTVTVRNITDDVAEQVKRGLV